MPSSLEGEREIVFAQPGVPAEWHTDSLMESPRRPPITPRPRLGPIVETERAGPRAPRCPCPGMNPSSKYQSPRNPQAYSPSAPSPAPQTHTPDDPTSKPSAPSTEVPMLCIIDEEALLHPQPSQLPRSALRSRETRIAGTQALLMWVLMRCRQCRTRVGDSTVWQSPTCPLA